MKNGKAFILKKSPSLPIIYTETEQKCKVKNFVCILGLKSIVCVL